MDEHELIWLAGLLEGEGTFDLHRGRYPRVRVGMTDRDVVGRAAALMGARARLSLREAPSQSTWHAEVSGPRAVGLMEELLPHMGSRRSGKIAEVLAAYRFARVTEYPRRSSIPGPATGQLPGIIKARPPLRTSGA